MCILKIRSPIEDALILTIYPLLKTGPLLEIKHSSVFGQTILLRK